MAAWPATPTTHEMTRSRSRRPATAVALAPLLLAMLLAWLYQRTGSLYPGMLAHAVNNATGLLLFYVFRLT